MLLSVLQLRRDLGMLFRSLVGGGPPPVVARRSAPRPAPSSPLAPRKLRVAKVVRETADAVTLLLEDPSGAPLKFVPGQFFTLIVDVDGETHRRAYSASSSFLDEARVAITSKRVAGGKVSNWLNDHARDGMLLDVLGPSGSFTLSPDSAASRHVVLVGGGSGITPLMAIARAVLAVEPKSRVSLVYGNRREEDIIFKRALDELASDRFAVRHVLGEAPPSWSDELASLSGDEHYVCGPEPMMNAVREALLARGVDRARIHEERFASPHLRTAPESLASREVVARSGASEHRFVVASGQTILEAGLAAGAPMPFSCAMGGCGACRVKLVSGEVAMEEPTCLSREEREGGYVLACVARPKSPAIVEIPQ